ncbi:MAG: Spy/CpxP family protein refolding chaperone [Cyanobacteria bacterium REEB67]|nr:Spy/CpxP family protein refolding chaperone [Cyanobacteria bacterium REEB67]
MRSSYRSLVLALSLVAFFGQSQVALAQAKGGADSSGAEDDGAKCAAGGPGPGGPRPGGRRFHGGFPGEGLGHMPLDFSMLNLSDEQKAKISTIRGRNMARAKEIRQQLSTKRAEMRDLMFSVEASNEQVIAKRNEMKPLIEEAENLKLSDFLAIRAVFTPEQRKKWSETRLADLKAMRAGRGQPPPDNDMDRDRSEKPPAPKSK